VTELWDRVSATQPVPDASFVLAAGALALLLVVVAWPTVRLGVTIVHEAGHAVAAVLVGCRLSGIRLHSDTSGLTVSRGRPRGPGMVVMLAAGYLAPALLGLLAAYLLGAGHAVGLLWLLVLLMAGLLVWVRNGYGLVVLLVLGGGLFAMTWWARPTGSRWRRTWSPGRCCSLRPVRSSSCSVGAGAARAPPTPTSSRR
jgi:hypothetical protein